MRNHKIESDNKQIRSVTNLAIAGNIILFAMKNPPMAKTIIEQLDGKPKEQIDPDKPPEAAPDLSKLTKKEREMLERIGRKLSN